MKFKINNHNWEIMLKDTEKLKGIVAKVENTEPCFVFGYTYYPTQKIFINSDCCEETIITTLKHELTHCYLWSYGFREVEYSMEVVCDIVAESNDFINSVVEKFKNTYEKGV